MDDTAMNNTAVGATELRSVLAFDGDCGFCQAAVRQMQLRARPRTKAVAWQALPPELTQAHLGRLDREVLLFDGGQVRYGGAPALARFLGSSPIRRYRLIGRCLRLPPISLAAHAIYRTVARNRHRMPGGTAACALPRITD
ncbi:thiol-disulfide oxidoreductase DCC family protein [Streptomyces sp. NPDC056831]|uniref:thiol-disulfide oxidoreductase DCC family protein n=1 Tax=Streptomyces sp. NPDC056831 TaxID=3345954 RepID=UPI0036B3A094